MRNPAAMVALLALAGCAGTRVGEWARGRHPVCDVHRLQHLIGRRTSPGLARHIEWASRAQSLRYVHVGVWASQELRTDRVTVTIDNADRITNLRCG